MPSSARAKPNLPGHQYVVLETDDHDDDDYGTTTTPADGRMYEPKGRTRDVEEIPEDLNDVDGKVFDEPTELELKTLRRVSGHIPWQAYSIAFVELCERFSWYGTTAVCESCRPIDL